MASDEAESSAPALSLKGRMYTALVLRPGSLEPARLAEQLAAKATSAPELFDHAPVVLDLQDVAETDLPHGLEPILRQIRAAGCVPYAVQAPADALARQARELGLAVFASDRSAAAANRTPDKPAPDSGEQAQPPAALLIEQPVRSGQQIYARGRDLVILASVSPGAEVMADGHIHVYGTLQGRALAGVRGDESARIFCRHLKAQLVAIAGCYRTLEDMAPVEGVSPVQVRLRDGTLELQAL